MKKSMLWLVAMLLVMSMFLAACSGKSGDGEKKPEESKEPAKTEETSNEPTEGGTVTYAFTQPFKGVLEFAFYEGEDDSLALGFMAEGLISTGDDLLPEPNVATWEFSEDNTQLTFKIKEGVKWHDGKELTAEDMEFAWHVIADPEYAGQRFTNVSMIKGAQAYKDGKADKIEGIEVLNDYEIRITVEEPIVNLLDNLWVVPMNKKHYEGVAVKDMVDSDKVRKTPVGFGPFKVKNIVPGEMIEFERFDDYWQGRPLLDGVVYKVIDPALASGLLESGEIDIIGAPSDQYPEIKELDNLVLHEEPSLGYSYIGFDWGRWDADKGVVVSDNPKFQNKQLRQAMAHALDRQGILDGFSNGLGQLVNVPFPSVSWAKIPDDQINGYEYDPEKAKKILDEAGYVDKDGDGFREDPKGEKFTVNFDAMSSTSTAEPRAQYILQNWKDVGIDARLNGGALKDFNLFYDSLDADDPSIDTFNGAWGLATDPDPAGIWLSTDQWNMWRWYSEKSDELIKAGVKFPEDASKDVIEHRKEIYYEWQKLVNDELPMIFMFQPLDVYAVNKRVQGTKANAFTVQNDVHKWWVKQE
ncbi:oligopeptide ABC transporter substrate-binding protein [Bacillus suaedaesalsae]|uniref:Oligopeptide ABC transporter substrate-binding protein n=1 Tax=Bacillus suaedaesalsae TaxID=2810349 RepID=A0ABS2DIG2_9BACI|nr:oligopeptide ABC transporter substrate-binding protein [Bacillus suaedaesalsae]MBM6618290.1 oligopeptide ABC transporter substrate-binding protein [Bacillus suaedaesalsae]